MAALCMVFVSVAPGRAETVDVKYRGPVNLAPFECTDTRQSSFVGRVCYDAGKSYMLIKLKATWYHYCAIDAGTVATLLAADSVGTYYNQSIRSEGGGRGPFDCRDHPVPEYP